MSYQELIMYDIDKNIQDIYVHMVHNNILLLLGFRVVRDVKYTPLFEEGSKLDIKELENGIVFIWVFNNFNLNKR